MSSMTTDHRPIWGFFGFVFAILALICVVLPLAVSFSEPPRQDVGTSIGELAADIRKAAVRRLSGAEAPAPVVVPPTKREVIARYMAIMAPVLAGIAAILGGIALLRREERHLPITAITLGVSAFVMQYALYLALLVLGFFLLVAIIRNMDGILGT